MGVGIFVMHSSVLSRQHLGIDSGSVSVSHTLIDAGIG